MGLPADFPKDPYAIIDPSLRWHPGSAELEIEEVGKLIPPLVSEIRRKVHEWRANNYPEVSETSYALLNHWFSGPHDIELEDGNFREFQYFFAQREAIETAVWLFEHEQARDPFSLMRYDSTGLVSKGMFPENWTRYVFKLATGAGKTKVISLLIAWSYFHKVYEEHSDLSSNFLLIAPNIIVLDRLRDDFEGLRIFHSDPVIPENGYFGRDWKRDFQLAVHVQDEVGSLSNSGNLFLTNVHRVFEGSPEPNFEDEDLTDFFLGARPVTKTTQKTFDVGEVVRGIDDLIVLNDEAHHIHDESLAWFKAIENIDAKMRQRTGHGIAAQFDVTATPKNRVGSIFVQTVCTYPLVEAIRQGVVKTPVVPNEESRSKLLERLSDDVCERYGDHLKLGYLEWEKRKDDLIKAGKKPVLFIMTTTTVEADQVAAYMERTYELLQGKVLVIHTKKNGEISENAGDPRLEKLREASRLIDSPENPYQCVVSVLMLREGWDVQNVIAMVGLRPYSAKSKVLPEQTLGRGLRRMFRDCPEVTEYVSVVGTEAFLEFVESIRSEGVELESAPMGPVTSSRAPLIIEVDHLDPEKDIEDLEIKIPRLSGRFQRQTKNLDDIDISSLDPGNFELKTFTDTEQRRVVFIDLDTDEPAWSTDLGQDVIPTPQSVIAFLTSELMRRMRLVSGKDILFGKLKAYIRDRLFSVAVNLDDLNVLRNLSEIEPRRHLFKVFANAINALTLVDIGPTSIVNEIKVSKTRPVRVNNQDFLNSVKTVFNRVVGDSNLELRFAKFLDRAKDVQSFIKNNPSVHFYMEYVNSTGQISNYYPDFVVRTSPDRMFVVETKGLEDLDVSLKWSRLRSWCEDVTRIDPYGRTWTPLFVGENDFYEVEMKVNTMEDLARLFGDNEPIGNSRSVLD